MCKHIGAVLYGVGAKLDHDPLLFFTLRNIDINKLIKKSVESRLNELMNKTKTPTSRVVSEDEINNIFGF